LEFIQIFLAFPGPKQLLRIYAFSETTLGKSGPCGAISTLIMKCGKLLLNQDFGFNWVISFVGAASSRDKRRQHGAAAIFAAGSRSHQV
jgi:hypothetical protein